MTYNYWLDSDGFDPYSNFIDYVDAYDSGENDPLMDDIENDFERTELSNEYEIDWDGEFSRDEMERDGVNLIIPLKKK